MTYRERVKKLNTLNKFINGKYRDDITLVLDKNYNDDKLGLICAVMHWFRVVEPYLDSSKVLKQNTKDYNWGNVYLYLCAVDIITKGINDLYKMITRDNKHIFKDEKDIFKKEDMDDNEHFQNIRAVFGAHPTDLNGNGEFFVATYPTPYNWIINQIFNGRGKWDYYTLLWSKKKSDSLVQKEFGFSFKKVDMYLDKYIDYLNKFYIEIKKMINDYYDKLSHKKINKIKDINRQIDLLIVEDNQRFKGKYNYELTILKILINININDINNEKEYSVYRKKLILLVPKVYRVIQNPQKYKSLSFFNKICECKVPNFDNNTGYYYSKLLEYENNVDMEDILISYFGSKIMPFNPNIHTIEELFCLVKAYAYYRNQN